MAKAQQKKVNNIKNNAVPDAVARRILGGMLGASHNGDRDLFTVFGYPKTLQSKHYQALYYRGNIASRIIRAFPRATWRDYPVLTDEESAGDKEKKSPFTEAWDDLVEEKQVYSYLERADRLSGLGQFSVLLMGFSDGETDLSKPLTKGNHKLLYLMPYSESNITIAKFDTSEQSPRFGLPEVYTLQRGAANDGRLSTPLKSITVHHSRVLHIAEYLEDDEVYGTPRLMSVYNLLKDIEKTAGGSAEMFWLYARNILIGKADPDASLTEESYTAIKAQMDDFVHQLRSYIMAQGMEFDNFQGTSPTPKETVDILLDLIAGSVEIPKRILIGSERGELASTQDENNWSERIAERRNIFAAPMVLRPFVQKMILTGNLPEPKGKWYIEWPENTNLSEVQQADVSLKRSQTLATYANSPGVDRYTNDSEIRESVGLDPDVELEYEELDILPEPIEEEAI